MMNTTALLEEENVNLDLDYLEGLVEQEKYPEEYNLAFNTPDDLSSIELPGKNNYTLEEIAWLYHALFLQNFRSLLNQSNPSVVLQLMPRPLKNGQNKRLNKTSRG